MHRATAFAAGSFRHLTFLHSTRHIVMNSTTPQQIATHDGTFHCDEVLACHMLRNHTATFRNAGIVRTRDTSLLAKADVVVDVGAEYDASKQRYDHHQRGFAHTFAEDGHRSRIKLSSAGLIYKHFGEEVVRTVLSDDGIDLDTDDLRRVYFQVYDCFMEAVDAIDNGIERYVSNEPPRYESSTDLSSRISRLNPEWNDTNPDHDKAFRAAMALAGSEFDACVRHVATSWLPARAIVAKAFSSRVEDDKSGCIMVLREWAPWKDHLYVLEDEGEGPEDGDNRVSKVLYVIYRDTTGNSWRLQCVPVAKESFRSRKPLPEPWRGVRDNELSSVTGIGDCIFVHASGFIGGNKTFEGAMALAKKAMSM